MATNLPAEQHQEQRWNYLAQRDVCDNATIIAGHRSGTNGFILATRALGNTEHLQSGGGAEGHIEEFKVIIFGQIESLSSVDGRLSCYREKKVVFPPENSQLLFAGFHFFWWSSLAENLICVAAANVVSKATVNSRRVLERRKSSTFRDSSSETKRVCLRLYMTWLSMCGSTLPSSSTLQKARKRNSSTRRQSTGNGN